MVLAVVATPALAADPATTRIVEKLKGHGYTQFEISRTWLGRSRIVASGPGKSREIILNPNSGEILRDYRERHEAEDDDHDFEDVVEAEDDDEDGDDDADNESESDDDGDGDD